MAEKQQPSVIQVPTSNSSSKRKKISQKLHTPPHRLRVNIMKPIHLSKSDLTPETPNTSSIKAMLFDFVKNTKDKDDSYLDEESFSELRVYKPHIIVALRNEVACVILDDEATKMLYNGKLGRRSGLYFLQKGRKHGEEVKLSIRLTKAIKKHGHSSTDLIYGAAEDEADLNLKTIEVNIAFV